MQARKNRGNLFIVSAPSGAGKTTLCARVLSLVANVHFSVSFTTRQPRPGEIHDKDYTFVSRECFTSMIEKGEFAEWAEVHGELYGTSRRRIETLRKAGSDVILDIDTQGAMQIRKVYEEGVFIFVLPPSLDVLKKRLCKRMTDSPEQIEKRLRKAVAEIKTYDQYDYVIINDIFEEAANELMSILIAQRAEAQNIDPLWVKERFFSEEA